jgi:hypothetical protein
MQKDICDWKDLENKFQTNFNKKDLEGYNV